MTRYKNCILALFLLMLGCDFLNAAEIETLELGESAPPFTLPGRDSRTTLPQVHKYIGREALGIAHCPSRVTDSLPMQAYLSRTRASLCTYVLWM